VWVRVLARMQVHWCAYSGALSCLSVGCLSQVGDVCDRCAVACTWMPSRVQLHMIRHEKGIVKLLTVTKTFVVKDAEFRDCGGRGMARGGKVNSTCCRDHKNAELVPDSASIRMFVRIARQVRVDSEILVMYQPDRGFFGGVKGRCRSCLCEKHTPECCA
jgi:hypothetical protein